MKDLKECPFCGSDDTQLHPHYGQASCRKCHATLEVGGFGWHHKPKDARIAWNIRTSIPISRIEELIKDYKFDNTHNSSSWPITLMSDLQKLIDEAKS